MNAWDVLAISAAVVAVLVGCVALAIVWRWKNLPAATAEKLDLSFQELDTRLAQLMDSHKRLRARVGMRELRTRRGGPDYSGEDDEQDELASPPNQANYHAYKAQLRKRVGLVPGKAPPIAKGE